MTLTRSDYLATADYYVHQAFGEAHQRAKDQGATLGESVFTIQEKILLATYYLLMAESMRDTPLGKVTPPK